MDGEEVHRGKNPTAWKLSPGIHEAKLLTYKKGESIGFSEVDFSIRVFAEMRKSAPKKSKKTSTKKSLTQKIIPEVQAKESTS